MKEPIIHHYPDGRTEELTDENIHAFDAETQMAYHALRTMEGKVIFLEKDFKSFKTTIRYDWIKEFHRVNPGMPMNLVVAKIIERLPNFIPGDKLVELTKFAVEEWGKIKENQAMEMAA